jgi:intracellular sulfur oxidation DsrE/DsrF family protein
MGLGPPFGYDFSRHGVHMKKTKLDRRAWMSGVGAAAAGVALGTTRVDADAAVTPPQAAQPATPFQPARHAQDEWFDKLPGKHRVILDVTSAEGSTWGIAYATNIYNASRTGYQIENVDLAMVLCLRHSATSFAFNNAMWAKYGKQLAEGSEYKDPTGAEPKANPRNTGERPALDGLIKRGAHFAVCGLATRRLAGMIAGRGNDSEAVLKELSENTIANAHIMAAGVVAVTRAQEYGYSLLHVG